MLKFLDAFLLVPGGETVIRILENGILITKGNITELLTSVEIRNSKARVV